MTVPRNRSSLSAFQSMHQIYFCNVGNNTTFRNKPLFPDNQCFPVLSIAVAATSVCVGKSPPGKSRRIHRVRPCATRGNQSAVTGRTHASNHSAHLPITTNARLYYTKGEIMESFAWMDPNRNAQSQTRSFPIDHNLAMAVGTKLFDIKIGNSKQTIANL